MVLLCVLHILLDTQFISTGANTAYNHHIASNLPMKTLVARQWPTNSVTCTRTRTCVSLYALGMVLCYILLCCILCDIIYRVKNSSIVVFWGNGLYHCSVAQADDWILRLEDKVRHWAAQIIVALDHLHNCGIVCRYMHTFRSSSSNMVVYCMVG